MGDDIDRIKNLSHEFTFAKWYDFKNLMPPDDICLDVLFHRKLLTFVMASQLGTLTVWKCGTENNQIQFSVHQQFLHNTIVMSSGMQRRVSQNTGIKVKTELWSEQGPFKRA